MYCAEAGVMDVHNYDDNPIKVDDYCATCNETGVVSNDDNDDDDDDSAASEGGKDEHKQSEPWPIPTDQDAQREFDLNGPTEDQLQNLPNVIIDEEDHQQQTPTAELLKVHYDFGHTSFAKLQEMAKQGTLPSRLAKCNVPVCTSCKYAKATKRPW